MRWLMGLVFLCAVGGLAESVQAQCKVLTTPPTYTEGQLKDITCDTHGVLATGGGAGSATAAAPTYTEGSAGSFSFDLAGNARVTLGTVIAGEDLTATLGGSANGVLVTEQRYLLSATVTSDTQIKGSAGFAKDVTCIGTDAAATAGSIVLYNKLTEAAPAIWTWNVAAAAVLTPITFPIDFVADTGLYLGFTTTADVACYVRYR